MIRMTKQTDYGILALTHFANAGDGAVLTARDVARETSIARPMVSKILKLLAKSGLLLSLRGIKGGYRLAKRAHEISVAEIITVLEGPLAMTECSTGTPGQCKVEHHCPVSRHWQLINHAVRAALQDMTLTSMTGPAPQQLINIGGRL